MKYSIDINQYAAYRLGLKRLGIDIIDLAIFDVMRSFAANPKCERLNEGSDVYFWLSYKKIASELPFLDIERQAVYRRVKKLEQALILCIHPDNQKNGKSFFKWGVNFGAMLSKDEPAFDYITGLEITQPPMSPATNPYVSNDQPPMSPATNDNNTIYPNTNHNTIDNKNSAENFGASPSAEFHDSVKAEKKEKEKILPPRAREKRTGPAYAIDDVKQYLDSGQADFLDAACHVLADYQQYRKELDRFAYKDAKSYALFVKSLYKKSDGNISTAQKIIDQSRENGWKGIFELKNENAKSNATNNRTTNFTTNDRFAGNPFFSGVK